MVLADRRVRHCHKYAESLIAVKYRVQTADGRMMGGAMYALERGLKWKKFGKVMAVLFALFAMLASFGIGCGTQINAIAEVLETNLPSACRVSQSALFRHYHRDYHYWRH